MPSAVASSARGGRSSAAMTFPSMMRAVISILRLLRLGGGGLSESFAENLGIAVDGHEPVKGEEEDFAAKDGNWALAAYMSKYMNGAMNPARVTKPDEYKVWKGFYDNTFAPVNKAIQAKDLKAFEAGRDFCRPVKPRTIASAFSGETITAMPTPDNNSQQSARRLMHRRAIDWL